MVADRLTIRNEMREFDVKNRQFYRSLTDEERRHAAPLSTELSPPRKVAPPPPPFPPSGSSHGRAGG